MELLWLKGAVNVPQHEQTAQCGTSCFKKAHFSFVQLLRDRLGPRGGIRRFWILTKMTFEVENIEFNLRFVLFFKGDLVLNKTFKTVISESQSNSIWSYGYFTFIYLYLWTIYFVCWFCLIRVMFFSLQSNHTNWFKVNFSIWLGRIKVHVFRLLPEPPSLSWDIPHIHILTSHKSPPFKCSQSGPTKKKTHWPRLTRLLGQLNNLIISQQFLGWKHRNQAPLRDALMDAVMNFWMLFVFRH